MPIKHNFTSEIADGDDDTLIQPSDWNALHTGTESYPMNFRLTLESGSPVSNTDQTEKTTLYLTPYCGNQISLYDGSSTWTTGSSAEMSLSLSGYTANSNYDIWCYSNSGIPTMESTIWSGSMVRATALTSQDGVLVKTGATTRRYIGTIRTIGTTGQCSDSVLNRYVYNYYNRVRRVCRASGIASATDKYIYFLIGSPYGDILDIGVTADIRIGGAATSNEYALITVFSPLAGSGGGLLQTLYRFPGDQGVDWIHWMGSTDSVYYPTGAGYLFADAVVNGANSTIASGVVYADVNI